MSDKSSGGGGSPNPEPSSKNRSYKPGTRDITTSKGKANVASEAATAGAKLAHGGKGGSRAKKGQK